jgi:hypothetical protein
MMAPWTLSVRNEMLKPPRAVVVVVVPRQPAVM